MRRRKPRRLRARDRLEEELEFSNGAVMDELVGRAGRSITPEQMRTVRAVVKKDADAGRDAALTIFDLSSTMRWRWRATQAPGVIAASKELSLYGAGVWREDVCRTPPPSIERIEAIASAMPSMLEAHVRPVIESKQRELQASAAKLKTRARGSQKGISR